MGDEQAQIDLRMPLIEFLQGGESGLDSGVVIGYSLVIEVMNPDGGRGALVMTSDASGKPLPWYAIQGHIVVLDNEGEFDAPEEDEDE